MTTILTLRLDAAMQRHFDTLRRLYYPAERNQISAHLTLFHTLPDSSVISEELASVSQSIARFTITSTGLRSLGRGVAYGFASPALLALHARLAHSFAEHLTSQDRQRFQPHIVIQNKVTPQTARDLLATLQPAFQPVYADAEGLDLWEYLGGPWNHLRTFLFSSPG